MAVLVGTVEAFEEIDVALFPGAGERLVQAQRFHLREFLGNHSDRNVHDRFVGTQFRIVRWHF
ncbi:hypothetical protein GCM10022284_63550 [Streptomyces hundungensis]